MLLAAALFLSAHAGEVAEAPDVSLAGFVLRPELHMGEDKKARAGGLAFVVDEGEDRFALTAYQLLGAPSGIETIPAAQVTEKVSKLALSEVSSGMWLVNGGAPLKTSMEVIGATASKDLVVFPVDKPKEKTTSLTTGNRATVKPGALAAEPPAKGESIWLVAPLAEGTGHLHLGTVAELNGDFLFYDIADKDLNLAGTSGAPLVNAKGEVVGVQVGVIRFEDGGLAGSAVPLSAIKARISEGKAAR
ncbi:MAG: hypothetical protein EP330_03160 [Deltaproteobacteria bacterium]|nr:MAG: hypothetical protein EP330_03160 [Deltaproteobacteria bacterium]